MDSIASIFVCGIIFYFTYMIFELFARKNERINLIEKMGQTLTPIDDSALRSQFTSLLPSFSKKSFTSLRIGCLLMGLGAGLLVGLLIFLSIKESGVTLERWERDTFYSISTGASVLLFGGLGLVISYIIEKKDVKNDEK